MYKLLLAAVLSICILTSCGKSSPNNPNNNNSSQDTLTAGWTMTRFSTEQFTNIYFVQNNGIAVSTIGIYGSNNGGVSWQRRSNYGNQAFGIGYTWRRNIGMDSVGNVIIPQGLSNGGPPHAMALSHDFINFTIVPDNYYINDSWFLRNNIGYAITANDQDTNIHFLRTINGGSSWNSISIIPRMPIITNVGVTRLAFINSQIGWVTTPYGVYKTVNGGATWTFQYAPQGIITNLSAVDANVCYVEFISFQGILNPQINQIGKTTDGGSNWQVVFSKNTGSDIESFKFVDANTGYMARGRWIYKSTDGGANWTKVVAINSSQCYFTDIYFTDANHGWACSVDGHLLRYSQ